MRTIQEVIATTHVDRQFEKLALSALEGMVEQVQREYIPMLIGHDPRIPPKGRLVSAKIEELEDGEYAVKGIIELFEPGEEIPLLEDTRQMVMKEPPPDSFEILFDRTYSSPEDQALLDRLALTLAGTKHENLEKGLETLSVLAIVGVFVAGNFFGGFLQKAGADSWDAIKAKLRQLASRKRAENREHVLQFQFVVYENESPVAFEVNITNPSDSDIDMFIQTGIPALDHSVPGLLAENPLAKKFVFSFARGRLQISFAVRRDAVPFTPRFPSPPSGA